MNAKRAAKLMRIARYYGEEKQVLAAHTERSPPDMAGIAERKCRQVKEGAA